MTTSVIDAAPAPAVRASHGGNGGMPARRAMVRWAVRLFRREWRQQILVIVLLTIAVTGAIFAVSATYHLPTSGDATFGRANQLIRFDGADPATLASDTTAARAWFGTIDVIAHRYAHLPGLFDPIDIRSQAPGPGYGAPMLALRQGHYPSGSNQIAVTTATARILRTHIGASVRLDGRARLVVGLVENPENLSDAFVLVDPVHADPPQSVTVLAISNVARVEAFRSTLSGPVFRESRPPDGRTSTALGTLALAAIALLLVSLVAAAGFVVIAQRRLRQLGMIAAIGAARQHLRLLMVANGTLVGAIAALLGTAIGLAVWLLSAGSLEVAVGHRIDRFDLPWAIIGAAMLLAIATATAAAWWPARAISQTPIMNALSARPPRPRPARRSASIAIVLLVAGVAALTFSGDTRPALIIFGALATAIGVLFLGPLAIRALAATRGGMPIAVRLALTDLARYQARAGAALAAISLACGICVAIVAGSAAEEYTAKQAAGLGNLSTSQMLVRIGQPGSIAPDRTPAQTAQLTAQMNQIAAVFGSPTTISLQRAEVTSATEPGEDNGASGHPLVELGIPQAGGGGNVFTSEPIYVATPGLLRLYGLTSTSVPAGIDVLTVHTEQFELVNTPDRGIHPTTQRLHSLGYSSMPDSMIMPAAMARHGWQSAAVGWFLQADHPFTNQEITRAQGFAASAGLTIEVRHDQASVSNVRNEATIAAILLALGILATTVGLIRGEGANDLRTLTATGASRRVGRTLTATTAGALALLGALLGAAGAYVALASVLHRRLDSLSVVPVGDLAAIVIGLPLLAAVAGWLLAGGQPPSFARRGLE
jgi:putative ABC transport system permease protein